MSDTNHHAHTGDGPVEGDGVHYSGLIWFLAIMAATVLICQALMFGTFKWLDRHVVSQDAARSPLAAPSGELPPKPNLLYQSTGTAESNEPGYLAAFRAKEEQALEHYELDKATGVATLPIEKAKELLLERGGLPVKGAAPAKDAKEAPKK